MQVFKIKFMWFNNFPPQNLEENTEKEKLSWKSLKY